MKTKFLPVLLILSGLLVTADKTYACNDPPNADLDASPNPVCVGCSVTLDGSGSSDPDGEITKYEWDWTNDGEYDYEETPGDGIATHIYTIAGTYTAKLRVTDDDDATDTDTCTVYVVKVASLLPDVGTEMDDGDDDPNTKSYVVSIVDANDDVNVVTVTATPYPDVNEANLPDCWDFTGGTEVNDFVHTVDRTTPVETALTCSCGTSSKTTKIYVVQVNISVPPCLESQELNPGKYINVNWDDDDDDGWEPNDTPPDGYYTGDKDDPNIKGGDNGDNDLRSFSISMINPVEIKFDFPDTKVELTFPGQVKVWETRTKLDANGVSSQVPSGTQFKVADLPNFLYLEGISGSSEFRDVNLVATYVPCNANDIVKVTVFEVDCNGLFGYGPQQNDDEIRHSSWTYPGSSDKNGKISWDDANADGVKGDNDPNCKHFHNCMELQGTVKPSGVIDEVEFDFYRETWYRAWKRKEGGNWLFTKGGYTLAWTDDEIETDEDLTPSDNDHIYQTDGPGWTNKERGPTWDYLAQIADFRERVRVKIDGTWYWCSDFYKWHTKCYTKPKDEDYMTRDAVSLQKLGEGWITVPDSP